LTTEPVHQVLDYRTGTPMDGSHVFAR